MNRLIVLGLAWLITAFFLVFVFVYVAQAGHTRTPIVPVVVNQVCSSLPILKKLTSEPYSLAWRLYYKRVRNSGICFDFREQGGATYVYDGIETPWLYDDGSDVTIIRVHSRNGEVFFTMWPGDVGNFRRYFLGEEAA